MGRAGINRVQVELAMEKLRARGEYPSLDKVLAITGGSKGTIKQLREEILSEQAASISDSSIMKELATLNADILSRMRLHAEREIREARAKFDEQAELLENQIKTLSQTASQYKKMYDQEAESHQQLLDAFQSLQLKNAKLEQQVTSLKEAVDELKADKVSLDEKHRHARDTLEHFREAAREQRDREERNHEQQSQSLKSEIKNLKGSLAVKLGEVAGLNRDNAGLTADVSNLRHINKKLEGDIERLRQQLGKTQELAGAVPIVEKEKNRLDHLLAEATALLRKKEYEIEMLTKKRDAGINKDI